jgi:hypothetical protein
MEAGLSLYEMIDLILREKIPAPFTPEEIREEAQELLAWAGGQAPEGVKG